MEYGHWRKQDMGKEKSLIPMGVVSSFYDIWSPSYLFISYSWHRSIKVTPSTKLQLCTSEGENGLDYSDNETTLNQLVKFVFIYIFSIVSYILSKSKELPSNININNLDSSLSPHLVSGSGTTLSKAFSCPISGPCSTSPLVQLSNDTTRQKQRWARQSCKRSSSGTADMFALICFCVDLL